jgi:hypothetical protein
MSSLDLSMNRLGGTFEYYHGGGSGYGNFTATPEGPKAIADAIKDMRALSVLNLASNNLGELVLPQGWTKGEKGYSITEEYTHTDGTKQDQHPGEPEGIIALANAIPDMGAMTELDVRENNINEKEIRALQEAACGRYAAFKSPLVILQSK